MKKVATDAPKTVDDYLAKIPEDKREALKKLRRIIRSVAPNAEEVISYGMPAFRQHWMLVYYAAFKDHCSFFVVGQATRSKFAEELRPFMAGKGTVHFTPEKPLPETLVRRIVKAQVEENEERAAKRRSSSRQKGKRNPELKPDE